MPLTFILAKNSSLQSTRALRMLILALAFYPVPYLVLTPHYFSSTTPTCFGVWFLLCLVVYGVIRYRNRANFKPELAKSRVVIDDLMLERRNQLLVQKAPFSEIAHVTILEKPVGSVAVIRVKTHSDYVNLRGFQGMNQIAAEIVARVPTSATVQRKRLWLATDETVHLFLVVGVLSLSVVLFLQGGANNLGGLPVLFCLGGGIYSFLGRPQFKREGKVKRSADVGTGIFYFAAAFLFLLNDMEEIFAYWQDPCALRGRLVQQSGCVETVPAEGNIAFAANSRTLLWSEHRFLLMPRYNAWIGFWTPHLSYDWVKLFTISANRQVVAVIGTEDGSELMLDVWDITSRTRQARLPVSVNEHVGEEEFALSPDGQILALSDPLAGPTLWQVATGEPGVTLARDDFEPSLTAVAFSPDGQLLAGQTHFHEVTIWQVGDGSIQQEITLPAEFNPLVDALRFSPDGRWLLMTNRSFDRQGINVADLLVWDLTTNSLGYHWTLEHAQSYYDVTFSPDGAYLFGAFAILEPRNGVHHDKDTENTLFVWNMETGTAYGQVLLGLDRTPASVSVAPDGSLLVVGTRHDGLVFDVTNLLEAAK